MVLRGRTGRPPPAPARASTQWSVPGTTRTATVHTEAGWQTAPAGDCRAGRQDRPARGGRSAERDLRGDFLGFSYGFRPGRSQHDALDALATAITGTPVNWILDTDLKSFDSVSQEWLVRFIEHRIGDQRIIRLVRKWLKAGVLEDGELSVSETGTPQGSVASPLFANVYLHYVFDLWANRWRRREAKGNVIILRYADDVVVGFEHEATHGASGMRCVRGWRSSRLRFTRTRRGCWSLVAMRSGKSPTPRSWSAGDLRLSRLHLYLRQIAPWCLPASAEDPRRSHAGEAQGIKEELRRRMHEPIPVQGKWLGQVVRGYFAYHAVPTNSRALGAFRYHVVDLWRRALRRRSQKDHMTWTRVERIADAWLPQPRILHPWPDRRFAVKHSR